MKRFEQLPTAMELTSTCFVHDLHPNLVLRDYSKKVAQERVNEFRDEYWVREDFLTGCGKPWDLVEYEFNHSHMVEYGRLRADTYQVPWTNPWTHEKKEMILDLKRLGIIDRENSGCLATFGVFGRSGVDQRLP